MICHLINVVSIKSMVRKTKPAVDFETALAELKDLVETMEQGNLSLEQALNQFEHGVALTKQCQTTLLEAEQKVKILMQNQQFKDYATEQDPHADID
jgi:exodeoxyribonuclease VII small subunit